MQRLDLDFWRTRRASPWAGRLLLVVALTVTADMGLGYRGLLESVAQAQASLARLEPRRRSAATVSPEEVALARETVQRLSLPWGSLFGALESAASSQVALLAIEPDPRAGTVTISGDSKDYLAALTYVLNLRHSDALASVQLVRHELKQNDPQRPVAFSVSASWTAKP